MDDSERQGAKKVLTAAALTYVAALLLQLSKGLAAIAVQIEIQQSAVLQHAVGQPRGQRRLRRLLKLLSREEAEDLYQETFLKFYEMGEKLEIARVSYCSFSQSAASSTPVSENANSLRCFFSSGVLA